MITWVLLTVMLPLSLACCLCCAPCLENKPLTSNEVKKDKRNDLNIKEMIEM